MDKERIAKKLIRLAEELLDNHSETEEDFIGKGVQWLHDSYYEGFSVDGKDILEILPHIAKQFSAEILDDPPLYVILKNGEVFKHVGNWESKRYEERFLLLRIGKIKLSNKDLEILKRERVGVPINLIYTNIDGVFGWEFLV